LNDLGVRSENIDYLPYCNKCREDLFFSFRRGDEIPRQLSFIGLIFLLPKYALVLALIAGFTEVIPYIGPVIGAVPAVFLAFSHSPTKALLVIALYVVIQQLENNIIVPKVMQRAVGLNPVVVIIVLLLGAKLAGVIGALLAIPLSFVNPRAGRTNNLIFALLTYMIYSNLISVSNAWVAQGKLSPGLGLWGIHALMLLVTVLMFQRRMMLFSWRRLLGKGRAQPEGAA